MKNKHSKHEWKSNTLPSIVMVGPVTLLLLFLVVAPLIFVAVMSFCQTDQYYNVLYRFSVGNYIKLLMRTM